jgi:hypothetical protein
VVGDRERADAGLGGHRDDLRRRERAVGGRRVDVEVDVGDVVLAHDPR